MFKDIKAKIELVNPKNICSRLWGFKNTEFVWELKWGFVKAAVSKAVHLQECLLHFVRELLLYSWTLIIWASIIWTCFPGPVFFSWTLRRCDLQKLKWFKVHLSFQTCFNHCFDLFRTWTLETVTYIQTANVSRSKFIIKFCFLYSLCLHFSLINIHIKSIIRTLDYLDYLINSQRVRIIKVQLYYQYV